MIGENFNYEDVFLRNVTVGLLDTLEGEIHWYYNFSKGKKKVVVPFYYSLTGQEKFLLDSFHDDVVSDNRLTDLDASPIPRGILTLTGFDMITDELTNPNVWIKTTYEDSNEVKTSLQRIRPIPISVKYDMSIILNTENDYFKCSEALMNTIGIYKYYTFQYKNFNINAVLQMPDSNQFEITRDMTISTKNEISLKVSFEVVTYYPGFRNPLDGAVEENDPKLPHNDAYEYDPYKLESQNNVIIPKRTRWFNNIKESNGGSLKSKK